MSRSEPIWRDALRLYLHPRVLAILLLGFSSGLPLALTFGTLSLWMAEEGISRTTIGLFALAGTPYTLKFLWSPLMDRLAPPPGLRRFGRRRGWILATQFGLAAAILALGAADPVIDPRMTALFALMVAFLSASQDIVIDAYRVEILEEAQYGAGAAMIVLGYRVGMLASGAGALYLATWFGWFAAYAAMALLMGVGIAATLLNPEPRGAGDSEASARRVDLADPGGQGKPNRWARARDWVSQAVIAPFADFMSRPGWLAILLFILLYKFGDALAGVMGGPFYVDLQFSKIEIANLTKLFGLAATLVGAMAGGVLVQRLGIMKSLLWCGLLQMLSNLMFVWLAMAGHDLALLGGAIAVENLSGGMGTAAFVAYLSRLCNVAYTATQYALLSSFMAFGRTILSAQGGYIAEGMSWTAFFLITTAAAVPGMVLLLWMMKRFPVGQAPSSG